MASLPNDAAALASAAASAVAESSAAAYLLDRLGDGESAFSYANPDFPLVTKEIAALAADAGWFGRGVSPAVWSVADDDGICSGALLTLDQPGEVRRATMYLDWRDLTSDRDATGWHLAHAIAQAIARHAGVLIASIVAPEVGRPAAAAQASSFATAPGPESVSETRFVVQFDDNDEDEDEPRWLDTRHGVSDSAVGAAAYRTWYATNVGRPSRIIARVTTETVVESADTGMEAERAPAVGTQRSRADGR
jgi:hypothetical protein